MNRPKRLSLPSLTLGRLTVYTAEPNSVCQCQPRASVRGDAWRRESSEVVRHGENF